MYACRFTTVMRSSTIIGCEFPRQVFFRPVLRIETAVLETNRNLRRTPSVILLFFVHRNSRIGKLLCCRAISFGDWAAIFFLFHVYSANVESASNKQTSRKRVRLKKFFTLDRTIRLQNIGVTSFPVAWFLRPHWENNIVFFTMWHNSQRASLCILFSLKHI